MGMESFGPATQPISGSPDWPRGVVEVLRHPSRVYSQDINGYVRVYFDGNVRRINQVLELFAKFEMAEHVVEVRAGRPAARSFDGTLTPYAVELDLPGGLGMFHTREHVATGLYTQTPRLVLHIDERLVERLDELVIPENVTLETRTHRLDAALALVDAPDRNLRGTAIRLLGEIGESTPPVIETVNQAAADHDEYIQKTARDALAKIESANQPGELSLRERVATFLSAQTQLARLPTADEILAALRSVDKKYADGFTARGTMMEPAPSGEAQLIAWTVTMDEDRLVIEMLAVEDADHPAKPGRLEWTLYVGPDQMATFHRSGYWNDGEFIRTKRFASFEPVGNTYDLLIGRMTWPLGRDFSRRIDRITEIRRQPDGTLAVVADSGGDGLMSRWELTIDPLADYLVRTARGFRGAAAEPEYVVDNAGTFSADDRSTAHTARWTEGRWASPVSFAVTSVSAEADMELIQSTEEWLNEQ
jgi:hypothetical protein